MYKRDQTGRWEMQGSSSNMLQNHCYGKTQLLNYQEYLSWPDLDGNKILLVWGLKHAGDHKPLSEPSPVHLLAGSEGRPHICFTLLPLLQTFLNLTQVQQSYTLKTNWLHWTSPLSKTLSSHKRRKEAICCCHHIQLQNLDVAGSWVQSQKVSSHTI